MITELKEAIEDYNEVWGYLGERTNDPVRR